MAKIDWRRCRYVGKPSIDFRREAEVVDLARRWIEAVERRQHRTSKVASSSALSIQRRSTVRASPGKWREGKKGV